MNTEIGYDGFRNRLGQIVGDKEPWVWAREAGISGSTFDRAWNGGSIPKAETLAKMAVAGGVTIDWLLLGDGSGHSRPSRSGPVVSIPHYEVAFSAGTGRLAPADERPQTFDIPEEWVRQVTGRNPANLVLAYCDGDSMEPTIRDGELMLLDRTDRRLVNGKIYGLRVEDSLLVKRISRSIKGDVLLRPDNPAYETEALTEGVGDVKVIGQVVWHGGSLA